jgi:hypothetical protein
MSVYDEIMWSRGFRRNEPKPLGRPDPRDPRYGVLMDRMNFERGYRSPLGGADAGVWSLPPAGLKPEFRPQAWRGSVPWQDRPGDMSKHQARYPGRK